MLDLGYQWRYESYPALSRDLLEEVFKYLPSQNQNDWKIWKSNGRNQSIWYIVICVRWSSVFSRHYGETGFYLWDSGVLLHQSLVMLGIIFPNPIFFSANGIWYMYISTTHIGACSTPHFHSSPHQKHIALVFC